MTYRSSSFFLRRLDIGSTVSKAFMRKKKKLGSSKPRGEDNGRTGAEHDDVILPAGIFASVKDLSSLQDSWTRPEKGRGRYGTYLG